MTPFVAVPEEGRHFPDAIQERLPARGSAAKMPLLLWTGIPPHFALTWWPAPRFHLVRQCAPRELLPLPPPAAQHACGEAPAPWAVPAAPTTPKLRSPHVTEQDHVVADRS